MCDSILGDSDNADKEGERPDSSADPTANSNYYLADLPVRNFRRDVFPEGEAYRKLVAFFEKHKPIDPKVR